MASTLSHRVRVPVRLVDGQWEFFYGGRVPVAEGALGEMLLDERQITDRAFLHGLKKKTSHKIMEEGARLMVALNVKNHPPVDSALARHLQMIPARLVACDKQFSRFAPGADTRFVAITVGPSKTSAEGRHGSGGIWLELSGLEPKRVSTSSLALPPGITEARVASLNHALTLLSETYEPWRRSHTGNVYECIFYQEASGVWHPLNVMRRASIASEERSLVRQRWESICRQLALNV